SKRQRREIVADLLSSNIFEVERAAVTFVLPVPSANFWDISAKTQRREIVADLLSSNIFEVERAAVTFVSSSSIS
ncbi:hypothetical protein BCAMP_00915, partial [Brochothrix campestris FSL F6-1037]